MTVLVAHAALAEVDRWWVGTGRERGVDKAKVYDLLTTAAREVEATWGALETTGGGSKVYSSRPDDSSLPGISLEVFDLSYSPDPDQRDESVSFIVVWDVRFWSQEY